MTIYDSTIRLAEIRAQSLRYATCELSGFVARDTGRMLSDLIACVRGLQAEYPIPKSKRLRDWYNLGCGVRERIGAM